MFLTALFLTHGRTAVQTAYWYHTVVQKSEVRTQLQFHVVSNLKKTRQLSAGWYNSTAPCSRVYKHVNQRRYGLRDAARCLRTQCTCASRHDYLLHFPCGHTSYDLQYTACRYIAGKLRGSQKLSNVEDRVEATTTELYCM